MVNGPLSPQIVIDDVQRDTWYVKYETQSEKMPADLYWSYEKRAKINCFLAHHIAKWMEILRFIISQQALKMFASF